MKPFVINTNSWHFKLTQQYFKDYHHCTDFCSYTRRLFMAFMFTAILIAVALLLLSMPVDFIYWAYQSIESGTLLEMRVPGGLFVLGCMVGFIGWTGSNIIEFFRQRAYAKRKAKQDAERELYWSGVYPEPKQKGVMVTWWETHHDKFCMPVKYED